MNKKMINYNFEAFDSIFRALIKKPGDKLCLTQLQSELNKFFKDSKCEEVIFTKNFDKLFFGMRTYAFLDRRQVVKIMTDDKPLTIKGYMLEIDSKLFTIGLTAREMTSVLLHEVGHLVNDSSPVDEIRKAVDTYLEKEKEQFTFRDTPASVELFKYMINDTIRKTTSIFTKNDDEVIADEFVFLCGYGPYLESAFRKIKHNANTVNRDTGNKLIAIRFVLDIYKNIGMYRLTAISVLNKSKKYSASVIEKKMADDAISGLEQLKEEDLAVREYTTIGDSMLIMESAIEYFAEGSLPNKIQRRGLRGLEEDLIEYQIRINNVEDETEALYILRQINARLSVIDDYLYTKRDLDPREKARWEKCFDDYEALRTKLADNAFYNKKNYGIWFDYNALDK